MRIGIGVALIAMLTIATACGGDGPSEPRVASTSTDGQLWAAIVNVDGRVSIGFKESHAPRGVDETGRNATSGETSHAMKRLLLSRGMVFSWQTDNHVSGRLPLSLKLVSELRRHPNIDYLEPYTSGTLSTARQVRP